jgi:hypothetical protein
MSRRIYGMFGVEGKTLQGSVEKLKEEKPLGMPRRRWEDNIKIDFQELGRDIADWINLTQGRNK